MNRDRTGRMCHRGECPIIQSGRMPHTGSGANAQSGRVLHNSTFRPVVTKFQDLAINVCGIHSKLQNGYFDFYCSQFDVLCFSGTKTCNYDFSDTLLQNYTTYTSGNDSREFFFADHGLCVLLRKEIAACFEIMRNTKSNHVLWLKDSILSRYCVVACLPDNIASGYKPLELCLSHSELSE